MPSSRRRLEETKPPMVSAARKPGSRPTPEEDPLNAWTWKCRIEGARGGVLAGKTVELQGSHRGGRDAHEPWLLRSRRLRSRLRCDRGHARPGGGRHHHRQERDERPEWRLRHRRRHRRLRPTAQPPQPRARHRRIVVRLRRGGGRRRGGHLLRRRPGRIHPHPGGVLRDHRPQADVRALVSHFGIGFGSTRASTTRVR